MIVVPSISVVFPPGFVFLFFMFLDGQWLSSKKKKMSQGRTIVVATLLIPESGPNRKLYIKKEITQCGIRFSLTYILLNLFVT